MPLVRPASVITPTWATSDGSTVRIYQGDVLAVLRQLPAKSVHCVVTSPPYWGLRDYGTGTWGGGDPACDHIVGKERNDSGQRQGMPGGGTMPGGLPQAARDCPKCGARRIDQQLGSESSPDCLGWARGSNCAEVDWAAGCYICRMVLVFREVRRVLRDDGVLWLNMGSSYIGSPCKSDLMALRNDLSPEDLVYVFRELAKCRELRNARVVGGRSTDRTTRV